MPDEPKPKLPEKFLWGASTSPHQVEGGTHNQWTVWELENAPYLARNAEKHYGWLSVWQDIKKQAQDPNNYISGEGVDHYHRYEEDFDLLKDLNLNALRFGIEWSRIEPTDGKWDEKEIEHYKEYIAALKKRGIQPVVNLWHWTMPIWFANLGGFEKKKNVIYFERFVHQIARELIIPCGIVTTVNEPNSYTSLGYLEGQWPPGKHSLRKAIRVMRNLAYAHRQVYKLLKSMDRELLVGVATQCNDNHPKRPHNYLDKFVAGSVSYLWNWWFLNRLRGYQDFIGFNFYFTDYFKGGFRKNPMWHRHYLHTNYRGLLHRVRHTPASRMSDLGWYMEPSGIYHVIMAMAKRYKKPIIITESGVADMHDHYRRWWLTETITAIDRAKNDGAQVIGYFYWSLLDNFEWMQGWWPKFGLIEVDREHGMKRIVRPSGRWYAKFLAEQSASK